MNSHHVPSPWNGAVERHQLSAERVNWTSPRHADTRCGLWTAAVQVMHKLLWIHWGLLSGACLIHMLFIWQGVSSVKVRLYPHSTSSQGQNTIFRSSTTRHMLWTLDISCLGNAQITSVASLRSYHNWYTGGFLLCAISTYPNTPAHAWAST